jgi:5'-phosphate synthase pdxT subunit
MKVGILALQGDFEAHAMMLHKLRLGIDYDYITRPKQLQGLSGLILPGGESTTMLKFLRENDFFEGLNQFAVNNGYFFGTCAGAILLAKNVTGPSQESLGLIDITIERNAYGRQLDSHIGMGEVQFPSEKKDVEMVFIRAPKIGSLGKDVKVFATHQGQPVGVMQGRVMVTTFHPELTEDTTIHRFFVDQLR